MTTKENPGTLSVNLYVAESPTVQSLEFTVLSEAAVVPLPHRETTETLNKLSQIVGVKAFSSDSHQLFVIAFLHESVSVGMKRVEVH